MGQKLFGWLLMASIIAWLGTSGCQDATGQPVASGRVWFFDPGTNNQQTVWKDATETATWTQPVPLDAGGRATVYAKNVVDIKVETSLGASVQTIAGADVVSSSMVSVDPAYMTGPYLSDTLIAANTSFGGPDFKYKAAPGATAVNIGAALTAIQVSVKSFGAKGDGLAIDTSAIQAAINFVKAAGGGVVYFPPGTYLIDAAIVNTGSDGVSFAGSGMRSSIIKQTNATANGLTISGSSGFSISKLQFAHTGTTTGDAISVSTSTTSLVIEEVWINDGYKNGIHLDACRVTTVRDCLVTVSAIANARNILYSTSGAVHTVIGGYYANVLSTNIEYNLPGGGDGSIVGAEFILVGAAAVLMTAGSNYSAVGCTGLASITNPFQTSLGTDAGFSQYSNHVEGYTEDVASGGTVTPNLLRGSEIRYQATSTGVAYVVAAPAALPTRRGTRLVVEFFNNAAGAVTGWTLNAIYHTTAAIPVTNLAKTVVVFEWDVVTSVFREVSRAQTT